MSTSFRIAIVTRLLALEALFNPRGGQRWGWIFAMRTTVPLGALRKALKEGPSVLNVTPHLAGLAVALWRRRLLAPDDSSEPPADLTSLSSALSARADRLIWGEARPTLLAAGLILALTLGVWGAFVLPVFWSIFVLGMLWWGVKFGSMCTDQDVVRLLSSPTWALGERMLGRLRRVVLGIVLGAWLAWNPGGQPLWVVAPLVGALVALAGVRSPLGWGAVGLMAALLLGYLAEALGAAP